MSIHNLQNFPLGIFLLLINLDNFVPASNSITRPTILLIDLFCYNVEFMVFCRVDGPFVSVFALAYVGDVFW